MIELVAEDLTQSSYDPYGEVIMAAPRGEPGKPANQGTARRYDHLAKLEDLRPGAARANLAVFATSARELPFSVVLLEKHPLSTQVFVPMRALRYLVVVALGGARPDATTLRAFLAASNQGITYRPGVWHHPLIALDTAAEFACLVWEDGSAGDCVEVALGDDERARVVVRG
jgi:ureidoglycolate lyase